MNNAAETSFIDDLQRMAAIISGHVLVHQNDTDCYSDGKNLVQKTGKGVAGRGDKSAFDRMVALHVLLTQQSHYDEGTAYCAVVSHWPKRAEDIVQFVSDTLDVPIVPMILTPETANEAFSNRPFFSTGVAEGNQRSAAVFGLFDREPK